MRRSEYRHRPALRPPGWAPGDLTWTRAETTTNPQTATPTQRRRGDDEYARRPVSCRRPVVQNRPRAGLLAASVSAAANSGPLSLVHAHRREEARASTPPHARRATDACRR